jgi:hypothetical protein
MNTKNHTSPSGEYAANGAIGEREAFLTWWCADVPEYMREKWKESVDECLRNNHAQEKLVGAWDGFQFGLTVARAALTAEKVAAEPVAIWRMVRANLNLIANSFVNCKGSAATMRDLAKDCLAKVDAYLDAAPQPAQTQLALTAAPRYREWLHLTQVGMWTAGVPTWARDHDGRMNDGIATRSVIEELALLLAAQPVSGGKS